MAGGWLAVVLVASSRRKGGVGAGDGEKERRKRTNLLVQRSVLSPTGVARAVFPFRRRPRAGFGLGRRIKNGPNPAKNEALGGRWGGDYGKNGPPASKRGSWGGLSGGRLELL